MDDKFINDFMFGKDGDAFTKLLTTPGALEALFSGLIQSPEEKYPYERLGDGYELRPIEILAEGGQFVVENRDNYSQLYLNGNLVTDKIFRKGGMGGKFKDGYCELIYYTQTEEHTEKRHGFDSGVFVIINEYGELALVGGKFSSDHPGHIGGHIASIGDYIYDLRTAKIIAHKSSSSIRGDNFIIIEHRFNWNTKEIDLPLGIYRIDYQTAEVTKIDDVKK